METCTVLMCILRKTALNPVTAWFHCLSKPMVWVICIQFVHVEVPPESFFVVDHGRLDKVVQY
jgi:hypothetical protein